MKKLCILLFVVSVVLSCSAGCAGRYKNNEWFSDGKLKTYCVPELPSPPDRDFVREYDETVYVFLSDTEYESYVSSIYSYLESLDLAYLGTRGDQVNTLAGAFTTYYFKPAKELAEFCPTDGYGGDYVFVFSDGRTDDSGEVVFYILILYRYTTDTLDYNGKEHAYNLTIVLRQGSEAAISGFYVLDDSAK